MMLGAPGPVFGTWESVTSTNRLFYSLSLLLRLPGIDQRRRNLLEVLDIARGEGDVRGEHDSGDHGVAGVHGTASLAAIRAQLRCSKGRIGIEIQYPAFKCALQKLLESHFERGAPFPGW